MNGNLRIPLAVSLGIHILFFAATSTRLRRDVYLNIPVDLVFYNPPAAAGAAVEIPVPDKDEFALPKKKAPPAKKNEVKKEEPVQNPVQTAAPAGEVQPSSQITLDQARFPYGYYLNIVRKSVRRNWQYSNEYENLKAVVYFRIERGGDVEKTEIEKSSGDPLFDQLALRAVKLSSPFPPLPEGYSDDYLGVHFELKY
jgi:TonB family protein